MINYITEGQVQKSSKLLRSGKTSCLIGGGKSLGLCLWGLCLTRSPFCCCFLFLICHFVQTFLHVPASMTLCLTIVSGTWIPVTMDQSFQNCVPKKSSLQVVLKGIFVHSTVTLTSTPRKWFLQFLCFSTSASELSLLLPPCHGYLQTRVLPSDTTS